jgi:threonine aldolase
MREAMARAAVGDDVIDIDPTVAELEAETAQLLGKEAALFMPSGTMTNQIAIRIHCGRGDEFICETECHIYNYEQGAYAQLSGVAARTVTGNNGLLRLEQLIDLIRPDNEHNVRTKLVCLENTHNRGAGRVLPYADVVRISEWARKQNLRLHLDGARLWNAIVASGIGARQWADCFDSVSVCFSKGLGAPVGSCLAGPREFIREARRARKLFGGAIRQGGIIAAGALYALRHHHDRLTEDHHHARLLGAAIAALPSLKLQQDPETNIVIFEVVRSLGTAQEFCTRLQECGVRALPFGPQLVRLVTHLDVDRLAIEEAAKVLRKIAG